MSDGSTVCTTGRFLCSHLIRLNHCGGLSVAGPNWKSAVTQSPPSQSCPPPVWR
ncbi:hypothetical protein ANANG_G00178570 [Anguilla anguilla]|uniref:Uncharacterized protein n=1 Tax=Anguilla anguilla TaxID=7936 RepID=A0A9D3M6I9_ANGAN|nr:hypothetical protein ANANG_G00178570 [Anguilla anguilla]